MRVFVSVFVFCHCICICAMSVSVRVSVVAAELKSLIFDVDCYVCHLDCSVVPQILVLHFGVFVFGDVFFIFPILLVLVSFGLPF